MQRGYGQSLYSGTSRARKHLRSSSVDDDDVLLPLNDQIAATRAFLLAPELKLFDTYLLATDCGQSADLSDGVLSQYVGPAAAGGVLFNPLLRDDYHGRSGKCCHVRSWQLKGSLQVLPIDNGTKIPQGISVFVALVQDKQTKRAQCSAANVFLNDSGDQNLLMCLLRNPFYGKRFEVLRSMIIDVTPNDFEVLDILTPDQTASMGVWKHFEFFLPIDCFVHFAEDASTIGAIVDNSWHVIAFRTPHNAVLAEIYPPVRMVFTSRFRFSNAPL